MNDLTERKEAFRAKLKEWCDANDPDCKMYPIWLRKKFWNHWTDMNDGGRKMFFEMEKTWSTGGRLNTCANVFAKDPRWKLVKQQQKINMTQPQEYEPSEVDYETAKAKSIKENKRKVGNIGTIMKEKMYKK